MIRHVPFVTLGFRKGFHSFGKNLLLRFLLRLESECHFLKISLCLLLHGLFDIFLSKFRSGNLVWSKRGPMSSSFVVSINGYLGEAFKCPSNQPFSLRQGIGEKMKCKLTIQSYCTRGRCSTWFVNFLLSPCYVFEFLRNLFWLRNDWYSGLLDQNAFTLISLNLCQEYLKAYLIYHYQSFWNFIAISKFQSLFSPETFKICQN